VNQVAPGKFQFSCWKNMMSDRPSTLKDLVVVIVGASSGFGRAAL
jgi:hypothetical protein